VSTSWKKSSKSGPNGGSCVEVRRRDSTIQVRDSKDPDGPMLTFTPEEWEAFVDCARKGELDL
jgi:hypothetical protein